MLIMQQLALLHDRKEVLGANVWSLSVLYTASPHSPEAVIQGRFELAALGMDAKP